MMIHRSRFEVTVVILALYASIPTSNGNQDDTLLILRSMEVHEYPIRRDLNRYFAVLDRTFDFFLLPDIPVDENDSLGVIFSFHFGLFLTNVNLKYTLKQRPHLPSSIKNTLNQIFTKLKLLLSYSPTMISKYAPDDEIYILFTAVFTNESLWVDHLESRTGKSLSLMNYDTYQRLADLPPWEKYFDDVNDDQRSFPTLNDTKNCFISLSSSGRYVDCNVQPTCNEYVINGTDFGHALTDRILTLLLARLGHGCILFSDRDDQLLMRKLCSSAFLEAHYIAVNNFQIPDLMLELMTFCGLDGYYQLLSRPWLEELLNLQTEHGCFQWSKASVNATDNSENNLFDGHCNTHVTAMAAAVVSTVIRFLILTWF